MNVILDSIDIVRARWAALCIGLMIMASPATAQMDLYLCIGQSNMAGRGKLSEALLDTLQDVYLWNEQQQFEPAANPLNRYSTIRKSLNMQGVGPAYSFARTMQAASQRPIGLVVNARGGSSIKSWEKGCKDGYYEQALGRLRQAMKQGHLKAVLWHQGESDVKMGEAYLPRLVQLITNIRQDLGRPDLPFIFGEIAEWAPTKEQVEQNKQFNHLLRQLSKQMPLTACVSSKGLQPLIDESDPHFSAESQIILGERYAKALLSLPASEKGLRVLFIGDSITDGNWGNNNSAKPSSQRNHRDMNHIYGHGYMFLVASYYQGKYPDKEYQFFNRGISGNTLSDLEKRWKEDVIDLHPDVLSILIGTNDIHQYLRSHPDGANFDFALWEQRYRKLLDEARQDNPKLRLVLGAPFTANVGTMRQSKNYAVRDSMVRRCAAIVKKLASDYQAALVPYDELFDKLYQHTPEHQSTYWIWDGIHPTPAGHRRMMELWITCVKLK